MSFNNLQSYVKMPVSTWCYIPTSLPQEQAAKTCMVLEVRIQVFSSMYSWEVCALFLHIYDWPYPHEAGKALHLMDRMEMAYTYITNPLSQGWLQASSIP